MESGLSVIICCYNGAERIEQTLYHISLQEVKSINWEVILVDNASGDGTASLASEYWSSVGGKIPLVLVEEPQPGLSFARKAGIRAASYDIFVFCDDDNHFTPNYIQVAFDLCRKSPTIGIVGGWCRPKLKLYPGKWIEANLTALATERNPKKEGFVDWVFGAGMTVKREVISKIERTGVNLLLPDRMGKKQTSGGDAELCRLARFLGFDVYYCPTLILDHQIAPHRLTRTSFFRANFKNVYPVVYLKLLDDEIGTRYLSNSRAYRKFLLKSVSQIFYFIPRVVMGKSSFYSLIMLFQNIQLFGWYLFRRMEFRRIHNLIRNNLDRGRGLQ